MFETIMLPGKMIKFLVLKVVLVAALTSCIHRDGVVRPQEIYLRLINDFSKEYVVVLNSKYEGEVFAIEAGLFQLKTPTLTWGEGLFLGVLRFDVVSEADSNLVYVFREEELVKTLSYNELMALPQDSKGVYELRVGRD